MIENPKSGISTEYGNKFRKNFLFINSFDYTEARQEKEVWAYPVISFIAEMGGSLGLFIGVSFLSVWDFGNMYLIYINNTEIENKCFD